MSWVITYKVMGSLESVLVNQSSPLAKSESLDAVTIGRITQSR